MRGLLTPNPRLNALSRLSKSLLVLALAADLARLVQHDVTGAVPLDGDEVAWISAQTVLFDPFIDVKANELLPEARRATTRVIDMTILWARSRRPPTVDEQAIIGQITCQVHDTYIDLKTQINRRSSSLVLE